MVYVVDIDQTICYSKNKDYKNAVPDFDRIEKINKLYDNGNKIIYFTARGMGTFDGNQLLAIQKYYKMTLDQLANWNVKFHQLILGKPAGDLYIDDKGVKDSDFFGD